MRIREEASALLVNSSVVLEPRLSLVLQTEKCKSGNRRVRSECNSSDSTHQSSQGGISDTSLGEATWRVFSSQNYRD